MRCVPHNQPNPVHGYSLSQLKGCVNLWLKPSFGGVEKSIHLAPGGEASIVGPSVELCHLLAGRETAPG